jgi:hypothetical protein
MIEPLSFPKFLLLYLPTLTAAAVIPEASKPLGDRFLIDVAGLPVPVVTCALGAIGILLSRPFTRRAEAELGWPLRAAVTLIMLIVAELWIIESRPSWLFAFVVSIGLGFAGFSLLELFGDEVREFIKRTFRSAGETIGKGPGE